MIHAIVKLLEALGLPVWVVWAVFGPLALLGYLLFVLEWFRFLRDLRKTTAAFGGRGLPGVLALMPGVRFRVHDSEARFGYSAWSGTTTMEFRVPAAGRIRVLSRAFSDGERRRFRGETVITGDPQFDASFTVLSAPARFGSELLDTDARHHLSTLQSAALAALERRREGQFTSGKLPNPTVELTTDARGLRIRFHGRPAGPEIERALRAGSELARRTLEVSRPRA